MLAEPDADTEDFDEPFTGLVTPEDEALGDFGIAEGAAAEDLLAELTDKDDAFARSELDAKPLTCGNGPVSAVVASAVDGCLLAARVGMIESLI